MNHGHTAIHESLLTAAPLDFAGFLLMLSYSLAASLHCAAMCAPLVAAQLGREARYSDHGIWSYNAGRAISYPAAGALLGLVGISLYSISWLGHLLSYVIAVTLAALGLWILCNNSRLPNILNARLSQKLTQHLAKLMRTIPKAFQSFALGLITVTLPCATLTPALLAAAGTASALSGAWIMLAFFLGTLPVMLLAPIVPQRLTGLIPQNWLSRLIGVFLILTALITVMRTMHH